LDGDRERVSNTPSQIAEEVAAELGIPASAPMSGEQVAQFREEFGRRYAEEASKPPRWLLPRPPKHGGNLRIDWPAPDGKLLPGRKVCLYDADTGRQIKTAMRVAVDPALPIIATATVFADENGEPVFDGEPALNAAGDDIRTVDVEFIVTDMRFVKEDA
jgi:hypothetical protein